MPLNIAFRCDASYQIGTGHVMRCLALAESLRHRGVSASFLCRELRGDLCDPIESEHFVVHRLGPSTQESTAAACSRTWWHYDAEHTRALLATLPKPCDWLVVDHYGLDREWEQSVRHHVGRIMVIDDLADRPHDCDLLLDQNLRRDPDSRYRHLVPTTCQTLLGSQYALLRSEFREARSKLRLRDGKIRRILVFFGGTDPSNQTGKALEAIGQFGHPEIAVDVVVGRNNPHRQRLQSAFESTANLSIDCQVNNMAERMAAADLGIGAGGITNWERCCVALPSLIVTIAANQEGTAEAMAAEGRALYLGPECEVTCCEIQKTLAALREIPAWVRCLSAASAELVDGFGCERIGDWLLDKIPHKETTVTEAQV